MAPRKKNAGYDDVLALPEHLVGEIIDGELIVSPRPATAHTLAASGLGSELFGSFNRPPGGRGGGWWILDEPEIHLGRDVVVPDLAGWRRARLATLPDAAFFTMAPDWICEVVSPKTERVDRGRKLRIYARARVGHAWLLNPTTRTLEVYRLEAKKWVLASVHEGDAPIRAEPFDAIALDPSRWWLGPEK